MIKVLRLLNPENSRETVSIVSMIQKIGCSKSKNLLHEFVEPEISKIMNERIKNLKNGLSKSEIKIYLFKLINIS